MVAKNYKKNQRPNGVINHVEDEDDDDDDYSCCSDDDFEPTITADFIQPKSSVSTRAYYRKMYIFSIWISNLK